MPSDLSNYLASRYLVADPKPTSKHKRKRTTTSPKLLITDDSNLTWTGAEFHCPVREGGDNIIKMSDGTHAGLQSASAVSSQLKRRQLEEVEDFEKHQRHAKEEETVYRDATGRRIDVSMKRADARRAAVEAQQKEFQARENLKGELQQGQASERKEELRNAKLMSFTRTAGDLDMNQALREQKRWNDPMTQFISREGVSQGVNEKSLVQRPTYVGASPSNRYGIQAGYRWDGVHRGIGFEADRFRALRKLERNKGLEYSWQMDG
ncbi:hypothetical protein RJ55_06727 [Drechmeria coniospora]|nr:hypothetical protein RJ55_06727 [Drechmeria coniospora]